MAKPKKVKLSSVLPAMAAAILETARNELKADDLKDDPENLEDYCAVKLNEVYSTVKEELLDLIALDAANA